MPLLPDDARIGEVALTVSDLDRSLAFYSGTLGFSLHGRDGDEAALGPAGGPVLVRLRGRAGAQPRSRRTSGLYHFAILVPSRAALGRSLRHLAEARQPLTGAADHLVSEALYLDDPDGLGIEIYRDRPRADWTEDRGEVLMGTEPLNLDDVAREPGAELPWSGLEGGTVIGHVHLHVPDLDAAEAFSCSEIGFEPRLRRYPGALFVAAGGYHHHLGLNTWAGRGAPPPEAGGVGLDGFTIVSAAVQPRTWNDETTRVQVRCTPSG